MFKKLTFLTAMFLLSFTLSVGAAGHDKTLIQEKQENFLDTADVKYAPYHGKLEAETSYSTGYNGFLQDVVSKSLAPNLLVEYAPLNNLQVDAFVSGNSSDVYSQGFWFDVDSNYFFGDAKYKFFNGKQLELAAKVYAERAANKVSYEDENGDVLEYDNNQASAFGAAILSNYNMKNITLYNNMGVTSVDGTPIVGMTTGFQTAVKNHRLLGKLDTSINTSDSSVQNSAALMYKAQLHQKLLNMLELNYNFNSNVASVTNTLEARVMPTALVTTQVAYSNAANSQNSVGLNVEKEFGPLTVKAGMNHKFEKDLMDSRTAIQGGVEYDVTQNVELSLDVQREMIDPAGDNNHVSQAKVGLNVKL